MRRAILILEKDIRVELAGMQIMPIVAVLSLLIVLIFGLAFGQKLAGAAEAAAILTVAILFGGLVAVEKCFDSEIRNDAFAGLRQTGGEVGFIFWGKVLWMLVLFFAMEIWTCAVFAVLFDIDLFSHIGSIIIIFCLFNIGFACIGVLCAAMTSECRGKGFLLAVLVLPLLVPPVLWMLNSLAAVFDGSGIGAVASRLKFIAGYDLIFVSLSRILFEKAVD